MKVTVCFGDVRILVPCGSGDLLVKDLINEATRRYKKASGKEPDAWVSVHHLQTQSGILDPDDCVRDVADDREYIHASFEDSGPDPGVPQGGGDGASGSSSVGTGSPDIFRDPTNTEAATNGGPHGDASTPHIEVTSTTACPLTGLGLQVRRSSDPNLLASLKASESGNKRWSAAAPHCGGESPERVLVEKNGHLTPQWEEEDDGQQQQATLAPAQQPFARSGRLSMQFLGDGTGYKWMEAAEKLQQSNQLHHHHHLQPHHLQQAQQPLPQHQQQQQQPQEYQQQMYSSKSLPRESTRKEPLGQAYESIREKDGEMLLLINEYGGPLGLKAIPDNEHGGGLLVQHVEPGSRAERGRLRRGDRILEINGTKLIGLTESKMQEYLRRALEASELRVRVIRAADSKAANKSRRRDSKVAEMIEAEEKMASSLESKVATVSPTRKPLVAPVSGASLQVANTRKLGRKIEIVLKKGPNGLGFSVTTRDNPAGGHCPIYIKNILPRGAAIEDGRLKPGDRLLEVDGVPMTGKTQTDVVSILRATQPGATVRLMVSRQQELVEVDERAIDFENNKENEFESPSKPPAPVLPPAPAPPPPVLPPTAAAQQSPAAFSVKKSNSARSLFEQHSHPQQHQHQQQQHNLNESQHFIDGGSESAASSDSLQAGIAWRSREMLTLHIPVHDTEKAGLGVSVKGKTSSSNVAGVAGVAGGSGGAASAAGPASVKHDGDLGIFVKSVIHGGAASRDGRLRMNDQLISVNGVSLLGQSNADAMETLRRAMVNKPGKHPGMITLSVARKISRSASSGDILEHTAESSNASESSGATVIYLSPEKRPDGRSAAAAATGSSASHDMNRWSNPVLDRLTGGVCSGSSTQKARLASVQVASGAGGGTAGAGAGAGAPHTLRNESYYMATNDNWSPALLHGSTHLPNGHVNNSVLIEDDPEPTSPTLPHRPNESLASSSTANNTMSSNPTGGVVGGFDATYSSQLSLETNNSGVEHFSRDALGRRSISEKHHAALDARETGTYQRNKKLREERERERRIQLTKSAVLSGSMESLTVRIAQANAQIPGYKHTKTTSSVDSAQQLQAEARDQVGDLGPSLGLKKSSSLESLQTMVQEIQMSDEPRGGPTTLRAPRGRGREDSLRAAVVSDHDVNKARKHWLLEDGSSTAGGEGAFANRNSPFQSSLNNGKHKAHTKKPGILRGIGYMFRFGKNRKDGVAPAETTPAPAPPASGSSALGERSATNSQIPAAALAVLDRGAKLAPPAYQPPPPLPPANACSGGGGGGGGGGSGSDASSSNNGGIHQSDIFNHRYQHYANYEELHPHPQMSRRHQHYHSQRSARSQDINIHHQHQHQHQHQNQHHHNNGSRPAAAPMFYDYETVQHNISDNNHELHQHQQQHQQQHSGSIKQNGHSSTIVSTTHHQHQQQHQQQHQHQHQHHHQQALQGPQAHWKSATLNGFSPANLNSSSRSRGPFVTHVTLGPSRDANASSVAVQQQQQQQQQPTYQTVQKQQVHGQYAGSVSAVGAQHTASKV